MKTREILSAIDEEIGRLTQARALLSGGSTGTMGEKVVKRVLSPEARKRIAEGQKRRWAAAKKKAK